MRPQFFRILTDLTKDWHKVVCIHDGSQFSLTMDDLTITACDEAFNHPMGPFYLNGGGFNGASDLVKDLTINTLLGSPRPTISSQSSRSRLRQRRRKQMPAPSDPTIHYYPIAP